MRYNRVLIVRAYAEDQKDYQSTGEMSLFLVNHSRPDIANVTKELFKANDGVNPAAFCELIQVIRCVHNIKNLGLKLELWCDASKPSEILCFINNDYA